MSKSSFALVSVLFLASSLTACGAGGGTLPAATSAGAAVVAVANESGASSSDRRTVASSAMANPYPIYSSFFTGNTPFHHTVYQLQKAGATTLSPTIAANYWAQGIQALIPAKQTGGVGPLYLVQSGDPGYTFSCPSYGTCDASGLVAHFPVGAVAETGTDHHITSFDRVYLKGELDGWGGDGNPNHACNLHPGNPGTATCSWGGFFPFSGDGLAHHGTSGQAGGYAVGLMNITAQELLQGHIDHAIGIDQSCLDNGGVYPSIPGRKSDVLCPANLEPNVKYGQLIHLKSSVNVASLGYSPYCEVIVKALQEYGGYTASNNGHWGIALNFEYMNNYADSTNPWFTTIFPSMVAGGDGSGSGAKFVFGSCLNRIPADDIEVIQISPNLPSA
jgi:hypothetical protein